MLNTKGSFTDLELWKKSRTLRNLLFYRVKDFPKNENYRMTDQIIRCSRSITANIAEGHGRYHYQENSQFCRIARGSLIELKDHLICAFDCKYLSAEELKEYESIIIEIKKMINGYKNFLKKRKKSF